MEIRFTVYGEPTAKGRPKFVRMGETVRTYTPAKTANYEALVQWEYESKYGGQKFGDGECIDAKLKAFYSIPKSASKKRKEQMRSGAIRPTKKPDADNVIKSICDGLNGVAYKDDAQIVYCELEKYYGDDPRVEVTLRTSAGAQGNE